MLEYIAGIIGIGRDAFLLGNRIFASRYEELTGALYSHYGEEAERNELRGNNEKITLKLERSKRNVHNFEHRSRAEVEEQSINSRGNQLLTPRVRRENTLFPTS